LGTIGYLLHQDAMTRRPDTGPTRHSVSTIKLLIYRHFHKRHGFAPKPLQGVADPNSVVIAESTRKLVGNLFAPTAAINSSPAA
jgi:hypothetical protein